MTGAVQERLPLRSFHAPTEETIRFLESILWGSQGLRYYVKGYAHALARLPSPRFFVAKPMGTMAGHVMFFEKSVSFGGAVLPVAYLSQLAVRPENRGQGLAGRLVGAVIRDMLGRRSNAATGITAYIEEANASSLSVFKKAGFHTLGHFVGAVINRVHPKRSRRAMPLSGLDSLAMRDRLLTLYADHSLADFSVSLKADEYHVICDGNGEILAGVQSHVEEWHVHQMDGLAGSLILNVLGRLPWFQRRVFNPASARFLHVGNLYARPGSEALLYELVEDALAREGVPFAVGYFDKRSPVYQRFRYRGSFGFMNAAMETPVRVMGWFHGMTAEQIAAVQREPLVISPLDIS